MKYNKLIKTKDGKYQIPSSAKVTFGKYYSYIVPDDVIEKIINFAIHQSSNNLQREWRSGGLEKRKKIGVCIDTFNGKCVECGVKEFCSKEKHFICSEVDISSWDRGIWDKMDFKINNQIVSVKSTIFYGNLLLLESKYIEEYLKDDITIFGRIKPSLLDLLKNKNINRNMNDKEFDINVSKLKDFVLKHCGKWRCDVVGCISKLGLQEIVRLKHIIKQNEVLNANTIMDADNYYIFASDLIAPPKWARKNGTK